MKYDIIVVGGGHAGCEASNAASKIGFKTALITSNKTLSVLTPVTASIRYTLLPLDSQE